MYLISFGLVNLYEGLIWKSILIQLISTRRRSLNAFNKVLVFLNIPCSSPSNINILTKNENVQQKQEKYFSL